MITQEICTGINVNGQLNNMMLLFVIKHVFLMLCNVPVSNVLTSLIIWILFEVPAMVSVIVIQTCNKASFATWHDFCAVGIIAFRKHFIRNKLMGKRQYACLFYYTTKQLFVREREQSQLVWIFLTLSSKPCSFLILILALWRDSSLISKHNHALCLFQQNQHGAFPQWGTGLTYTYSKLKVMVIQPGLVKALNN